MYRYSVDNVITYTPADLVLFRESPFAVWMERLTLENPEHGIPPDIDGIDVNALSRQRDAIVATLRAEGRNVVLIEAQQEEPDRRIATLETMRAGADFIVGAHLAVGNLAGTADMLMRTSGYSELGDFLYIPCETHADSTLHSAFRLCFIADLLANLQGQLPPQLLIIRDGAEVVPLQADDHIYYYRAVQRRFIAAMQNFRKHRMPDPAESAHFGRWAECASEVLKQREFSEQQRLDEQQTSEDQQRSEEQQREVLAAEALAEVPQLRVASGAGARMQFDRETSVRPEFSSATAGESSARDNMFGDRSGYGVTLAEQASLLRPDSYRSGKPPGHTPSLARIGKPRVVADTRVAEQSEVAEASEGAPVMKQAITDTLENLEFIGSVPAVAKAEMDVEFGQLFSPAPAPNLREVARRAPRSHSPERKPGVTHLADLEPRAPVFLPPDLEPFAAPPPEQLTTHSREDTNGSGDASSVIDMDTAPVSTLPPVVQRARAAFERLSLDDPMFKKGSAEKSGVTRKKDDSTSSSFSNSLRTSEEFSDN